MKKRLSSLLVLALVFTMLTPAFAFAAQNDAQAKFDELKQAGIFTGYPDGTAGLDKEMNRAQFATVIVRLLGLDPVKTGVPTFSDTAANAWYTPNIEAVYSAGIMNGVGYGKFNPNGNVTLEQMAVILVRALGYGDQIEEGVTVEGAHDWAAPYVALALDLGLIEAADDFTANAVRGQLVVATFAGRVELANQDAAQEAKVAAEEAAKDAVEAFFNAPVDSLEAIEAAEELGNAALEAAMEVEDENLAASLFAVIMAKATELDSAKTKFEAELAAEEAANQELVDAAEQAVAAYEDAPLTTLDEVTAAEQLKVVAEAAVAEVTDEDLVADFNSRIAVQADAVATAKEDLTPVAVESVQALNLKELAITFTKPIDADSIQAADFGFINNTGAAAKGSSDSDYVLSADKKTVVMTLDTAATNQQTLDLTVSGIEDVDGNTIASTTYEGVELTDLTVPVAQSIELTGPMSFEVTYSEPVQDDTVSVLVENGIYGAVYDSIVGNTVKFLLTSELPEGNYKVEVAGIKDFNNLKAAKKTFTLAYAQDTVAPTVAVDSASQEKVTVVFSKPVKNVVATNFYHTFSAWNPLSVTDVDGNALIVGQYYEKVVLVFANGQGDRPLVEGTNEFHILVGDEGSEIQDKWGNILASDVTLSVTVSADRTAPTVAKVEATDEDILEVTYSEDVVGAATGSNYKVFNSKGEAVTTGFTVSYDADDYVATLDFDADLEAGYYTVQVENVVDKSIYANKIVKVTKSFAITDLTAPTTLTAEYVQDGDKYYVYVAFDGKMNAADILNKDNYRLNGNKLASTDTIALFGDTSKVKITTTTTVAGLTLAVKNVTDAAGNKLDLFGALSDTITSAAAPAVDSVKTLALNKIEVKFNKNLSGAPANAFTVNGYTPASVIYTNNSDGTATAQFILRAEGNLTNEGSTAVNVTVVLANAVKSYTGQPVAASTVLFNGAATDGIAPVMAKDAAGDYVVHATGNTVTIQYSENIDVNSLSKYSFKVGDRNTVSVSATTNVVTITVDGDAFVAGDEVTINQLLPVTDGTGNEFTYDKALTVTAE